MRPENITVNALWIGKKLMPTELLTIRSYIDHGHKFVLWAYDNIETTLPDGLIIKDASDVIPKERVFNYKNSNQFGHGKGSYAGFSDIFRYKLLYEYGGWWTDMDVTCLKPLDFEEGYVFRTHHSLPMVGNVMKCPAGCELMKKCFDEASEKVDENNTDWHLPIEILVNNVIDLGLEKYIREFSNPDSWNLIRKFLKKGHSIPENWYIIHWVNEEWRRNKIPKNVSIGKSMLYQYMQKHKVLIQKANFIETIQLKYRLSKLSFGIRVYKNKF
ncbi:MAG: hypothetical protein C0596_14555 [Marinilabiliales bacterium]|nr:MAG: hypothetical protein C0596_14555 [Marinilabiliales bacterium]